MSEFKFYLAMTLEAKLECPLRDLARLKSLVVSNSIWREVVFIQAQQGVLAVEQTTPWALST